MNRRHLAYPGGGGMLRALVRSTLPLAVLSFSLAAVAQIGVVPAELASRSATARLGPDDAAGFERVWFGTYDIAAVRRVDDPKAPAKSRGIVVGNYAPVQSGSSATIVAKAKVNFGVAFRFRKAPDDAPVDYRAVWRFPQPGLTNPKNGNRFLEYESAPSTCTSGVCVHGWTFSEPWEEVPGTWILELWRGNRMLLQQAFEVELPDADAARPPQIVDTNNFSPAGRRGVP